MIRLSKNEIAIIKSSIHKFDSKAIIYLFGSRVDSSKKGGDIDLLIFSQTLTNQHRLEIKHELFKFIEEQKIDIIITKDHTDPFVQMILSEGVLL